MSDVPHPDGYERSDVDPRLIVVLAACVAAFLLTTPFLLKWVYPGISHVGGVPAGLPQPPPPRLQVAPERDLARLRSYENGRLDSYNWADRDHTAVHMPIGHAMELLAARGLSGWPSEPAARPVQR